MNDGIRSHAGESMTDRRIRIVRLYADQAGESHFSDEQLETAAADFVPPRPLSMSQRRRKRNGPCFSSCQTAGMEICILHRAASSW